MTPINAFKHFIKKQLLKRGFQLEKIPTVVRGYPKDSELRFSVAELLIERELSRQDEAVVVQIGAFDGKSNDFTFDYIKKYGNSALLVEPQSEAFETLVSNYEGCDNLIFEQIAIANYDGVLPFFRIKKEYHHSFRLAPQLASSDPNHLRHALSEKHLKGLPSDREQCIECVEVPCMRFDSMLKKHGVEKVSVLQIDTEGFDYEIIKMIDFDKVRPQIINFEIVHLSWQELDEAMSFLYQNGYELLRYGINMIARQRFESSVDTNFYQGVVE